MSIRRREFLVGGGVALLAALQGCDAESTTETHGSSSTLHTPPAGAAAESAPASPIELGNSFPGLVVAGGKSYYQSQVQMNPVSLYAARDGTGVVATSQYCEDNRSVRMYNNNPSNGLPLGLPSGPFVNDSTTNQHLQDDGPGVDSVLDASNVYTLAGGFIAKSARSNWAVSVGTEQNPGVTMHAATLLSGTGYGIAIIGSRLYVIDSMIKTGNPAAHTVGAQSPAGAALRVVPTSLGVDRHSRHRAVCEEGDGRPGG